MRSIRSFFLTALIWAAADGPADARVFTDSTGKKIEADLVKTLGDQVTIRMGGKEFTLPIARFSAEDQQFIRESTQPVPEPASSPAPSASPASGVQAGATLTLEFPDLAPDRRGEPAKCQVSIPAGYDPGKKVPLVVWLGGGDGGNAPNRSFLPEGEFVAAGLPYPRGANNPDQASMVGEYEEVWAYHKRMIDEIIRRVPNIDPSTSILGGFSNGGHAIDGMLRERSRDGGLADYFRVFILVDGGGSEASGKGSYPSLKGKFAWLAWGEESSAKANVSGLERDFKSRGAETATREMEGVGHAFPETEQALVQDWLGKTVLPLLNGGG